MTDTPARLVRLAQQLEDQHAPQHMTVLLREAAKEMEELRAALREHACRCEQRCVDVWEDVREHVEPTKADCRFHRARAALGEKETRDE